MTNRCRKCQGEGRPDCPHWASMHPDDRAACQPAPEAHAESLTDEFIDTGGDSLVKSTAAVDEGIGLSIDMLDADRLREWARLLLVHGADISHWASVPRVAGKMQIMATNIEQAVRDIGTLREETRQLKGSLSDCSREYHAAINETEYAGTREDWKHRALKAEAAHATQQAALEEAFNAGFYAHPAVNDDGIRRPGAWDFDADGCAAGDRWREAYDAWVAVRDSRGPR